MNALHRHRRAVGVVALRRRPENCVKKDRSAADDGRSCAEWGQKCLRIAVQTISFLRYLEKMLPKEATKNYIYAIFSQILDAQAQARALFGSEG